MINVKPTKNHKKSIKAHKRLFEKWNMWEFAFKQGRDYYFIVAYMQITGKVTGYLILDQNGNVPSLDEAKIPSYNLVLYNTKVNNAVTEMVIQMKKSMKPYEEMYEVLMAYKDYILKEKPLLESSINSIIEQSREGMKRPVKIRDIVMKLGNMQREITRGTGYFEIAFLNRFEEEYGKYAEIIYTFIKREEELKPVYEELRTVVSLQEMGLPASGKKKIIGILGAWLSSFDRVLKKSISSFELDDRGNKIPIDLTNIKHSISKSSEEIAKRDFKRLILPIMRNPK
ncbi:hypothetical protein LCM23_24780 [Cytobacillus kochii]|uniref:hypothetical protein n=1 Tax=Cytobacillus kochii TaxID=859143 RepID=UPI001CD7A0C7|nr:hypothetical protein [Cytobacillus kochii]MCA1029230.1 hypothetical protein [Cytobacillus kochii]